MRGDPEADRSPPSNREEDPAGKGWRGWLKALGPGFITGASDDDPSGIATYAQAGAKFGFDLLWTILLTYPLMVAIQEIAARIGRVTGRGLAANLRHGYPRWLLYGLVGLLLVANTLNIGADIAAIGAAANLLVGGNALIYMFGFTALSLGLEVWVSYRRYARILSVLTVSLLAYVATAFAVKLPWPEALTRTAIPRFDLSGAAVTMIVAILGTTISPYLFFWQASQEVEEQEGNPKAKPLVRAPRQAPGAFRRLRADTIVGMLASNLIAWFIIATTAATLRSHGVKEIESAAQAAKALEPVAGRFASLVFSIGIIGTGLLALPVLAGSSAYAVGEALALPVGLDRKPFEARVFYSVIGVATLLGLGMNLAKLDPIKALVLSAVVNGVAAVPIMALTMHMARSARVMKRFTVGRGLAALGWLATGVMGLAAIALLVSLIRGS